MAYDPVDNGSFVNDPSADTAREAFEKINDYLGAIDTAMVFDGPNVDIDGSLDVQGVINQPGPATEGQYIQNYTFSSPGSSDNTPHLIKICDYSERRRLLRGRISGSRSSASTATGSIVIDVSYGGRLGGNGELSAFILDSSLIPLIRPVLFDHAGKTWIGIELSGSSSPVYPTSWLFTGYYDDVLELDAVAVSSVTNLTEFASAETAKIDLWGTVGASKTVYQNAIVANGDLGTSATIDWRNGNIQKANVNNNVTLSFTDPPGPATLKLLLNNASATNTITLPGDVTFTSGAQSAANGAKYVLNLEFDGADYWASYDT